MSTGARGEGVRTVEPRVVRCEGEGGVVLDKDLDEEGAGAVATAGGLEEAGLSDAAGGEWGRSWARRAPLFVEHVGGEVGEEGVERAGRGSEGVDIAHGGM